MFGMNAETMLRTGLAMVDANDPAQLAAIVEQLRGLELSEEEREKMIALARTVLEGLGATTQ